MKNLNNLTSLQNQVEKLRLQYELSEQNFHEDKEKLDEELKCIIKVTSREITRTTMETSIENNIALTNLNDKFLEILTDRGILASYFLYPLSEITNPGHSSQFKLVRDASSDRVNDLLINKTIPVTLFNNLLKFCDKNKEFE